MVVILYEDQDILTVGALVTLKVVEEASDVIHSSNENGFRIAKINYNLRAVAGTDGQGPLKYGISMNVANATELEAILRADPTKKTGDDERPSKMAFVKVLGVMHEYASHGSGSGDSDDLQGGSWKTTGPLNWSVPEGEKLGWWVQNLDSITLTTGASVFINAEIFGVWLRD